MSEEIDEDCCSVMSAEITRLKSELAAARKALEKIAGLREFDLDEDWDGPSDQTLEEYVAKRALAALSSKEPEGERCP